MKIAVVNFIGGGDWLQAFEAGAKRQADALGVDLRISEARQDPDAERQLIEQAINLKVDGLIINNGKPEALKDVAQKAVDAGIKVVAYDVNLDNPKIAQIEQSDHDMARLVLEQAVKDQGDGVEGRRRLCRGLRAARSPLRGLEGVRQDARHHGGGGVGRGQRFGRRLGRRPDQGGVARPSRDQGRFSRRGTNSRAA